MGEIASIRYCTRSDLDAADVATVLEYCFEELGCGGYVPPSGGPGRYRYLLPDERDMQRTTDRSEAVDAVLEAGAGLVGFGYDGVGVDLRFYERDSRELPGVALLVADSDVETAGDVRECPAKRLVLELYDVLAPRYVYGDTYLDASAVTAERLDRGELPDLFWVNGFGPELADSLGREWLLEAPAWRVHAVDDGGAFVWLAPSPVAGDREQIAAAEQYFGHDRW